MDIPRSPLEGALDLDVSNGAGNTNLSNSPSPSNQVSWASAFWPVITFTLTLMLQSVGRVGNMSIRLTPALRCSPALCTFDTISMLVELLYLRFRAHRPFKEAACHVWYNRFDEDPDGKSAGKSFYPGSDMDSTWRYAMFAFLLGALPQAIKVFGMRGISGTTWLISISLVNFIIPEVFRVYAGPAGKQRLRKLPFDLRIKRDEMEPLFLVITGMALLLKNPVIYALYVLTTGYTPPPAERGLRMLTVALTIGIAVTAIICGTWYLVSVCITKLEEDPFFMDPLRKRSIRTPRWMSGLVSRNIQPYDMSVMALIFVPASIVIIPSLLWSSWDGDWQKWIFNGSPFYKNFPLFMLAAVFWMAECIVPLVTSAFVCGFFFVVLFMGPWSAYPRRLTGVTGSAGEFLTGCFVLIVFGDYCSAYCFRPWDAAGTYKPGWAEYLG